jgi:class 3 adenylate cyclase/tetratricopeptide (TPR) repeat protein
VPAEVEERKVVTALFADLVSSTELAARLDPEELSAVVTPFLQAMTQEIERFGGTVEKYAGDGVIAVFGAPIAHDDDPERAVRAALAMLDRLGALQPELARQAGRALEMRIGVETGEVVAAIGREAAGMLTGGSLHVASRLQSAASPGTIAVGERAWRDTRDAIVYRPLDDVELRGLEGASRIWRAVGIRSSRRKGIAASVPFVGRGDELALLELLLLRSVRERRPQLVSLVGPAGIGKSRLAGEFAVGARDRQPGLKVVAGRCLAYGGGLPFWPLGEIVKADAAILDSDPAREIVAKASATLEKRLGTDGDAVDAQRAILSSIGILAESGPESADVARRRLVHAWTSYVDALASGGPLLVVLEDIHWADPALLDLLEELPAELSTPTTLLCLCRQELFEQRPTWGGGAGDRTTIELSPLNEEESTGLTSHLLGMPAPDEVVHVVRRRSEGNPFFTAELLRMLSEDGSLALRDGSWTLEGTMAETLPDTVQAVIAARIDRLPWNEKQALQEAAVVGRTFWAGAVAGLGGDTDALDALVERGLLVENASSSIEGERELAFIHVLTRDVAYASIPRTRRTQAHAATGAWIENVTRGREEEYAEILAHHFERSDDASRAARYAAMAGDRSRKLFVARDAIRWYERGLEAAATLPLETRRPAEARLLLGRSGAYEQVGHYQDAEADINRALVLARGADDVGLLAEALTARNHVLWLEDRYHEAIDLQEAVDAARRAGKRGLVSRLYYSAGAASFGLGHWDDAIDFHHQALEEAVGAGDRRAEAFALHGLGESLCLSGPPAAALEYGDRGSELMRELGERALLYENEYIRSLCLLLAGRLAEADRVVQESVTGCRAIGDRRNLAFALAISALTALPLLELDRASERSLQGVELAQELESPRLEMVARVFRATVHIARNDVEGTAEEAGIALRRFGTRTKFHGAQLLAIHGWVALRRGDEATAREFFARARAVAAPGLLTATGAAHTEVIAWCDAGEADGLEDAGARLRELAGDDCRALLGWADFAAAAAMSLRGEDASEPARRAAAAALATGDLRLGERVRSIGS